MRPDAERARAPIFDQVGELSDRDLVYEFGPRVWWDEHGYPTVIAFGQWAWSPEGLDKRKKARYRDFAMEQAESDALSHLAMFVMLPHASAEKAFAARKPRSSIASGRMGR